MTEHEAYAKYIQDGLESVKRQAKLDIKRIRDRVKEHEEAKPEWLRWRFCPLHYNKEKDIYKACGLHHLGSCTEFSQYLAKSLNRTIKWEFNTRIRYTYPSGEVLENKYE